MPGAAADRKSAAPRACSIAATLDVIGEKWALLAVREVMFGVRRFDGIARNTGAPRDVLAARLRKLVDAGVLVRVPYSEHPPRHEYELTGAGRDLSPVLLTLKQWGDRHAVDSPPVVFAHTCGETFEPRVTCTACAQPLHRDELRLVHQDLGPRQHIPARLEPEL